MRAKRLALLLPLLLPVSAIADNTRGDAPGADEELPDADLLEFIAEFEPLADQWVDPIQLNMIFAENRKGKDNE